MCRMIRIIYIIRARTYDIYLFKYVPRAEGVNVMCKSRTVSNQQPNASDVSLFSGKDDIAILNEILVLFSKRFNRVFRAVAVSHPCINGVKWFFNSKIDFMQILVFNTTGKDYRLIVNVHGL